MADKKYNIPVGDAAIEVPAWATEVTLQSLSNQSANAVKLTSKLLGTVKKNKDLDDDIIDAVKTNTQIGVNNADVNQKEGKARTSLLVKGAEMVRDTAGFFGDSEKPLTSMVKVTETVVNKLKGSNGKLSDATTELGPFKKFMKTTGKQMMNVAVDIGLAWAGWNAAKFEQFAEVQKSMIDSGAVVFETADTFNQLYTDAFKLGITYKTFSETISNFGGTMVGLGGDVSQGSKVMMSLFKRLEYNVDDLGDLGLTNKELLNTYAGFIESQRLTGALDRRLADGGGALESSFTNLVMEAGAVANLTALSRSEAMNRMLGAVSDPMIAAGLRTLEERGKVDTANVVRELAEQLSLFTGMGPSNFIDNTLLALQRATAQYSGNMQDFDITPILAAIDQEAIAIFEAIGPDALDQINDAVRNAEANGGEVSANLIFDIIEDFNRKGQFASQSVGTIGGKVQDALATVEEIMINMKGLSGSDLEAESNRLKTHYKESGTAVVAMNDMSKAFLTAQEAITLDMQNMAESLEFATSMISDGSSFLSGMLRDYTDDKPTISTEGSIDAAESVTNDAANVEIDDINNVEEYSENQKAAGNTALNNAVDILDYPNDNTVTPASTVNNNADPENDVLPNEIRDPLQAQLSELSYPELKDRLTDVIKERIINNKMSASRPDLLEKMMENARLEEEAIKKQIKVHEDRQILLNRNDMITSFNEARQHHQ